MAKTPAPKPDEVETFDFEQRSQDWHDARRGVPTASKFSIIMASGKDGDDSKMRTKLLHVMAGEILTGETAETFRNESMERGVEMEPEARAYYARTTLSELKSVGFVKRTIRNPLGSSLVIGCSPDSLVDADGCLEIKTMRPDLLIPIARAGAAGLPSVHRAQCQGTMWVTGRAWCDLQLYYRKMPVAPRFRMMREETYIRRIRDAVEAFTFELNHIVDEMRSMGPR